MHVVVVGCGRVGSGLAVTLEDQGHTVAVIDRRAEAFRRLPEGFTGDTIRVSGSTGPGCARPGSSEPGHWPPSPTVTTPTSWWPGSPARPSGSSGSSARIYDQRRAAIYERLGIPTVATVQWTIERVLRRILPDVSDVEWIDPSRSGGAGRAARAGHVGRPPGGRARDSRAWPGCLRSPDWARHRSRPGLVVPGG